MFKFVFSYDLQCNNSVCRDYKKRPTAEELLKHEFITSTIEFIPQNNVDELTESSKSESSTESTFVDSFKGSINSNTQDTFIESYSDSYHSQDLS